jgi:hypothetical protein
MPIAGGEPELRALLDERAIREVLVRYCRGVDRCDEALLRSVYHPDATDEHGPFRGSGDEFASFVVTTLRQHFDATMHVVGNVAIELDGDAAGVESGVVAYHAGEAPGGGRHLVTVGGRYLDRFERRDGEWKIARRVVVIDWSVVQPVERTFPSDGYRAGGRWPDDPSYAGSI